MHSVMVQLWPAEGPAQGPELPTATAVPLANGATPAGEPTQKKNKKKKSKPLGPAAPEAAAIEHAAVASDLATERPPAGKPVANGTGGSQAASLPDAAAGGGALAPAEPLHCEGLEQGGPGRKVRSTRKPPPPTGRDAARPCPAELRPLPPSGGCSSEAGSWHSSGGASARPPSADASSDCGAVPHHPHQQRGAQPQKQFGLPYVFDGSEGEPCA